MRFLPLMLALLAGPAVGEVNEQQVYEDEYSRYVAWGWACELTVLCVDVRVPEVVYEDMQTGLRGYYSGDDTVFIHRDLRPGPDRMSTLIHEMIHYIHVQKGLIEVPGEPELICWSENQAFTLVDRWLVSQGYENRVRGPEWWKPYWHCHPYYDPEWDLWEWVKKAPR